jgi:hypothetical protein
VATKGCFFTELEIKRIVTLLGNTDMTIPEIAQRMSCSRSAVAAINRKFQIRKYQNLRSSWVTQQAGS